MWEIALVCRKRLVYVGNGLNMWETAQKCGKRLKYMENGLDIC